MYDIDEYREAYYPTRSREEVEQYWLGQVVDLYLIHADRRYPRGSQPRHYLGKKNISRSFTARYREHASGYGARVLRAMREEGISFRIVRVWRKVYRRQEMIFKKRWRRLDRLCPICNPSQARYLCRRLKDWGW